MSEERGRLTPLGPGREFDRIRAILTGVERTEARSGVGVRVGPGDDAAVLSNGLVLTTDLSIQGVHFRLDWITPEEAGYRAAAAGLSDLAAMAAEPVGLLVSVAAPGEGADAVALMAGVKRLAARFGAAILGGDLTRSPGPILVDVVSVGRTDAPLLRSGVRTGDELWVTGSLGGAAAAVASWKVGRTPSPEAREAFVEPTPRVEEARWLASHGARAGLDLSDGLAGDARHLAAASGVAIILSAEEIPLHPALAPAALPRRADPLELALRGGEDYELLVAAPPGSLGGAVEEFRERFGVRLTRVGRAEEGSGVVLETAARGGKPPARRPLGAAYDHFAGEEPVERSGRKGPRGKGKA